MKLFGFVIVREKKANEIAAAAESMYTALDKAHCFMLARKMGVQQSERGWDSAILDANNALLEYDHVRHKNS